MKVFGFFMRHTGKYLFLHAKNKPTAEKRAAEIVQEWCATFGRTMNVQMDTPKVTFWSCDKLRHDINEAKFLIQKLKRESTCVQDTITREINREALQSWRWNLALAENPLS